MSYAMSLAGTHESAQAVRGRNPFTGEMAEYHTYSLSDAERAAAAAVLERYHVRPLEDRDLEVTLGDGSKLELTRGENDSIYIFGDAAATDAALAFVFELASAASYVIGDDSGAGVTDEAVHARLDPEDEVQLVRTVDELRERIKAGWATD